MTSGVKGKAALLCGPKRIRQRGIEPPHPAPEAGALSTELLARDVSMLICANVHHITGALYHRENAK